MEFPLNAEKETKKILVTIRKDFEGFCKDIELLYYKRVLFVSSKSKSPFVGNQIIFGNDIYGGIIVGSRIKHSFNFGDTYQILEDLNDNSDWSETKVYRNNPT